MSTIRGEDQGLARAFAETVWLEAEGDTPENREKIEAVFGTTARAGSVVFHDAWPERWPELVTDILNSHHPKYFQNGDPPGDWEDPVPVYFLSVEPKTPFRFAVAPRRTDTAVSLVELARRWLIGGLTQLGVGAKTASGYGDFIVADPKVEPITSAKRPTFTATLELVTPAFLAGAVNTQEYPGDDRAEKGCDLRPSTLRGQLRWWWRTMHAGFVTVEELRAMEAAIWGDTKTGGAVRVVVKHLARSKVELVPGKKIIPHRTRRWVLRLDPAFEKAHQLEHNTDLKRSQGFLYLSYGMDEMPAGKRDERKQRHVMHPGATWNVTVTARSSSCQRYEKQAAVGIEPERVLEQAQAALWLLCRFGGVGSKSRHGFGSLHTMLDGWTLERVREVAGKFRQSLGVAEQPNTSPETSALDTALPTIELSAPWQDVWFALDQVGFSLQKFAQEHKRKWRKEILGLPRKIGVSFSNEDGTVIPPGEPPVFVRRLYSRNGDLVWLGQFHNYLGTRKPENMRHASPVHFHWEPAAGGGFRVRVICFPTALLADEATSRTVLTELLGHLSRDMRQRVEDYPPTPIGPPPAVVTARSPAPQLGGPQRVEVVLLERMEKSGKNAFRVQENDKPRGMLVDGTPPNPLPTVAAEGEPPTRVTVYRELSSSPSSPRYRWSPPAPPPLPVRGGPRRK